MGLKLKYDFSMTKEEYIESGLSPSKVEVFRELIARLRREICSLEVHYEKCKKMLECAQADLKKAEDKFQARDGECVAKAAIIAGLEVRLAEAQSEPMHKLLSKMKADAEKKLAKAIEALEKERYLSKLTSGKLAEQVTNLRAQLSDCQEWEGRMREAVIQLQYMSPRCCDKDRIAQEALANPTQEKNPDLLT